VSADFPLTVSLPINAADPGMLPLTIVALDDNETELLRIETRFFVPANPD